MFAFTLLISIYVVNYTKWVLSLIIRLNNYLLTIIMAKKNHNNGEEEPLPMANMDQVISTIDLYQNITNRRLFVYKSTALPKFREYRCRCSIRCIFRAKFKLRRSDNKVILSSAVFHHIATWSTSYDRHNTQRDRHFTIDTIRFFWRTWVKNVI